jgi:hypothetical protein
MINQIFTRRWLLAAGVSASAAVVARRGRADGLAQPSEKPILTITGKIDVHNKDDSAVFDRPMLEALGTTSFTTATPWYDRPVTFQGVPMVDLLRAVGAHGDRVVAVALNDYSTEIPISDFAQYGVIVALKRDGNYLPVRDKGPLFIVYPYDNFSELKQQKFYARSAWQVAQLNIK